VDYEISLKAFEESQSKLFRDLNAARQEVIDTRSKSKISQESKNQTEMELINARYDIIKLLL
jgi:hypothetical protein